MSTASLDSAATTENHETTESPEPIRVLGLVGNPAPSSRTARVAQHVVALVRDALGATATGATDSEVVELADRGGDPSVQVAVGDARVLVVATPAYKGSYTGLLKLFLDTLAGDGLRDTVVVPVVVAGSPVHATMTDLHLRWVLGELGGALPVPSVVLAERDLAGHDDVADAVDGWRDAHLAGVVAAVQAVASSRSTTRSANDPALAGTTSR
jgi:FMN reductase